MRRCCTHPDHGALSIFTTEDTADTEDGRSGRDSRNEPGLFGNDLGMLPVASERPFHKKPGSLLDEFSPSLRVLRALRVRQQ